MEHFLLPAQPTPEDIKVPYVCTEPYDGGPFHTYGERKGKEWLTVRGEQRDLLDVQLREGSQPTPAREQEKLFQAWFFFGLLQTVFGSLYKREDYIYERDGGSFVTTRLLIQHMDHSFRVRCESDAKAKRETLESAAKCLRVVSILLPTAQPDFDWRINLSLASVCELFANAVIAGYQALKLGTDHLPALSCHSDHLGRHVKDSMLEAGWCPSDVAAVTNKFRSLQTLRLLSRIDKSGLGRDHASCTTRLCRYYQIKPGEYVSKHRGPECSCKPLGVVEETVRSIIREGRLPLLKITGSKDDVRIEVVRSTKGTTYIALSHVWADGMGNPRANALPACQLAFLGQLTRTLRTKVADFEAQVRREQSGVAKLMGSFTSLFRDKPGPAVSKAKGTGAQPEPMLIWLDTLCCPISPPEVKSLAISRMRETYLDAAHVLVLDADCNSVALQNIGPFEAIARAMASAWTTRLWCLQEGILARKLWFQFSDGPEDVLNLFVRLFQEYKQDFRKNCVLADVHKEYWFSTFRSFQMNAQPFPSRGVGHDLYLLDLSMQNRSCSVASDEAICISTILGLSLEELLSRDVPVTVESRMAKVWEMAARKYGGLPQGIIRLGFPRLDKVGYRWAPRTLLTDSNVGPSLDQPTTGAVLRMHEWMNPKLCLLTENGLVVDCPGFIVRPRLYDDDLGRNPWAFFERKILDLIVPFRGNDGALYSFVSQDWNDRASSPSSHPLRDLAEDGSCALLRLGEPGPVGDRLDTQFCGGLVGKLVDVPVALGAAAETVPTFAVHGRVVITKLSLTPAWNVLFGTAGRIARALRGLPLTSRAHALVLQAGETGKEIEELRQAVAALETKIEDEARAALAEDGVDGELSKGLSLLFGGQGKEGHKVEVEKALSLVVKEWFHSDFEGDARDETQKWCLQ